MAMIEKARQNFEMNQEIKSKSRFQSLLHGYKRAETDSAHDSDQLGRLLEGFNTAHERGRKLQVTAADDFNLLETLQIDGEEIRHSMMLAWLLDREGTHAQDNLGFKLFLKHVGLKVGYANAPYRVQREKRGAESRIDVEVAARGEFIIHIENKICSDEICSDDGNHQTSREWSDLQHRARELVVQPANVHGLYLTLDGHRATNPEFRAISWRQIADVLDEFSAQSQAKQVSLFATHYAQALRRMTFEMNRVYEDENEARPEP